MGSANRGWLAHGQALPERGVGFVRARVGDDTRYGTPALLSALMHAAAHVEHESPGGAPLAIGDLSARDGGDHDRHGSHRTGRDVDVLFYLVDAAGSSVRGSGFYVFDERGVSQLGGSVTTTTLPEIAYFDTARNWSLVRALLTDVDALVQWIFCAAGIKARLLAYASAHEPDASLLTRAAYVLHQPSSGNPHADHFHIRIACTARERALGCVDPGPIWPWLRNEHEKPSWELTRLDDATLLSALLDDPPVSAVE